MFPIARPSPLLPCLLAASLAILAGGQARASAQDNTGSVILRMCKSGDKVKMLSLMCRSYLNGYLDAALCCSRGKAPFCLDDAGREGAPAAVVGWIEAHPESLEQPAGEVLKKALAARFPCTERK